MAELDGATLRIGGKSASIADLLRVRTKVWRVNFVPVRRTIIFTFHSQDANLLSDTTGGRRLRLPLHNVTGGRKAAEALAARALAFANGRAAVLRAEKASGTVLADDGFDPDAIIARYLCQAGRAHPEGLPAAPDEVRAQGTYFLMRPISASRSAR